MGGTKRSAFLGGLFGFESRPTHNKPKKGLLKIDLSGKYNQLNLLSDSNRDRQTRRN